MSGIAGFVRLDHAPAQQSALERMLNSIALRGPDASGAIVNGVVALGQRTRFGMPEACLDVAPRRLGHLTVVADVRLDNRSALARALLIDPLELATLGDPSLVLRAFEAWGDECPERLLGDFAFAVWDSLNRRLFCARDHFGARPFVYVRAAKVFAFASDTRGLHALGELPKTRNEGRIADFIVDNGLEAIDATSTFYVDFFRLPAAHTLVIRDGIVTSRRYWAPAPGRVDLSTTEDIEETFRKTFTDAVTCRVRGDSVGSMLSGGLDSSAIVAVAKQTRSAHGSLRTFSAMGDASSTCPDRAYVEAAIEHGGLDPTILRPSGVGALADIVRAHFEQTDDPFDSYVASIPLLMFALAKRSGVAVLVDGVDGDIVTSQDGGAVLYPLRDQRLREAWRSAGVAASHFGARSTLRRFVRSGVIPLVWASVVVPHLSSSSHEALRAARRSMQARTWVRSSLIDNALARRVDVSDRIRVMNESRLQATMGRSGPDWDHAGRLGWAAISVAFERYDRVAASQSVETSHPFFDRRLVDLCLSLPWQLRTGGGQPKRLLRTALRGALPGAIADRPWSPSPHDQFLQALLHALEPWLHETFGAGVAAGEGLVDTEAVRSVWRAWRAGDARQARSVWKAATLLAWLRRPH